MKTEHYKRWILHVWRHPPYSVAVQFNHVNDFFSLIICCVYVILTAELTHHSTRHVCYTYNCCGISIFVYAAKG